MGQIIELKNKDLEHIQKKINNSNKSQKSYRVWNLKDFFHKQPWELRPNDFILNFFLLQITEEIEVSLKPFRVRAL